MMSRSNRADFPTVPPAGAAVSDHVNSFFDDSFVEDENVFADLFDMESPYDPLQGVNPSGQFQVDYSGYTEYPGDQSRFITNQKSGRKELDTMPDDWFCGNDNKESEGFANLQSSVKTYLSTRGLQDSVIPGPFTRKIAHIDQHGPNGRVPTTGFAFHEQPGLTDRNRSNGIDSYGDIGSLDVNRINGLASYSSPSADFDIYGQFGGMDNYPPNGLDAYDTPMSIPPASQSQFVPLYVDEAAFRNRGASKMARRTISDYPANDLRAQHDIIARIYSAIRNTNDVQDSEKVAMKFSDASIPDEAIHEICWEIMLKCRDSQEMGSLVAKYHGTKHTEQNSFTERIDRVIETLTKSKAACKQALAPSFIDRLADQPDEELKRKSCNQKLNSKKTGQNKAGQQAIAKAMADAAGKWIKDDMLEDDDDPQASVHQPLGPSSDVGPGFIAQHATERPLKRARKN